MTVINATVTDRPRELGYIVVCVRSLHWSLGAILVVKVFSVQARGPEFRSPEMHVNTPSMVLHP